MAKAKKSPKAKEQGPLAGFLNGRVSASQESLGATRQAMAKSVAAGVLAPLGLPAKKRGPTTPDN